MSSAQVCMFAADILLLYRYLQSDGRISRRAQLRLHHDPDGLALLAADLIYRGLRHLAGGKCTVYQSGTRCVSIDIPAYHLSFSHQVFYALREHVRREHPYLFPPSYMPLSVYCVGPCIRLRLDFDALISCWLEDRKPLVEIWQRAHHIVFVVRELERRLALLDPTRRWAATFLVEQLPPFRE